MNEISVPNKDIADKPVANIDHWYIFGKTLIGKITNHPRQKEFRGTMQMTSEILQLDEEK